MVKFACAVLRLIDNINAIVGASMANCIQWTFIAF